MQFDKPEHKDLTLQLISVAKVPGEMLDTVYEFKQAVINASVSTPDQLKTETGQVPNGRKLRKTETTTEAPAKQAVEATETAQDKTSETQATETASAAIGTTEAAPVKRSWPARTPRGK